MPREIQIRGDTIRLGQLLKLAGIADSGGEARALVERGVVRVNGEVEKRRGRQLHPGDEIAATLGFDDTTLVARRWAMLEALSPAPDHRSEPRPIPRIHTTRTLSPSAAISSPGWS